MFLNLHLFALVNFMFYYLELDIFNLFLGLKIKFFYTILSFKLDISSYLA